MTGRRRNDRGQQGRLRRGRERPDLEGVLHALDILRFEDALNKPGPEFYALNVLIPLAIEKYEAARRAMEDEARSKATLQRQVALL
jgi:hypothetical protein